MKGENFMTYLVKKCLRKHGSIVAAFSMFITMITANATCTFLTHQEELPDNWEKLRKF
jgi:cyclic lactone autoinducer peptide